MYGGGGVTYISVIDNIIKIQYTIIYHYIEGTETDLKRTGMEHKLPVRKSRNRNWNRSILKILRFQSYTYVVVKESKKFQKC